MTMKNWIRTALVLLILGIAGGLFSFRLDDWRASSVSKEEMVQASDVRQIRILMTGENIRVVKGQGDHMKLRMEGRASKHFLDDALLQTRREGDTLVVAGTEKKFGIGFRFISLTLTVELPAKQWDALTVNTDSGDIELTDIEAGALTVQSDSGDALIAGVKAGQLQVKTDSGDIRLDGVDGNTVMETDSGDVEVTAKDLLYDTTVKTDSGDVKVSLADKPSSLQLQFRTDSGDREVEWLEKRERPTEPTDGSGSRSSLESSLPPLPPLGEVILFGSGHHKLWVETDSGDFELGHK
ncbi:DUF4097 family beta strand repeat-containing protein [Paenibacillus sp. y28]|uniref:DUF4097 family beta strand repeat-containing protein n=1 Tax=Paenibacillus sp. y28 TaxID=3129110 RepID=UPI0030172867